MSEPRFRSALEMLAALEDCVGSGARFVSRTSKDSFYPYAEVLQRARRAAGYLQGQGVRPGDRIGIILPTSIHFLDCYLGAILAGALPAAIYPPFRLGKLDEYYERTANMLEHIGARFLVTDSRVGKLLGTVASRARTIERALAAEELALGEPGKPVSAKPDDLAFLQFSSGSTRNPKAVMITHRNLLENLSAMAGFLSRIPDVKPGDGGVCWLPLYHDMGLVGCLFNGLYFPGTVTYLKPEDFVVQPSLWLQTISRVRGQVSPAPHFAYRLCATKIKDSEMDGVDLSCWRVALNGAESIEQDGLRMFAERFAKWGFQFKAMTPAYGLAEAGLAVTFHDPNIPPRAVEFDRDLLATESRAVPGPGRCLVSVGTPANGTDLVIANSDYEPVVEGCVGIVMVKGGSISPGYYADKEATASVRHGEWLDTGDLGFLHDGELFIVGRAKDLIIVRGRNWAPQEIEEQLFDIPGVRTGCAVAVSCPVENEGEQVLVLAERDRKNSLPDLQVSDAIRSRLLSALALPVYLVQMLEPGTLPRTSSGKFRRSEALRMFIAEELAPPDQSTMSLFLALGKSQLNWGRFKFRAR